MSTFPFIYLIKFHPCTCTVNWFNEHLYSKLVLCIMSIPCTFFSLVMSVPCTFLLLVMSVPCTFLLLVMSICVIFLSVCLQYRCTQNQFRVQVYTKPVYSTDVYKTSLQCRCTQNQFRVQVYTKQVYSTCAH